MMSRRSSLILPRKFRRHLTGATTGGGGGGFTTLGPNAPPGLVSPWPDFLGDTLPYKNDVYGPANLFNIYGWGSVWDDARCYTIEDDPDGPVGKALRLNFYAYNSPRSGVAWAGTAGMGGPPCKGWMQPRLFDASVGRRWKKLYIHMWQKWSANFSLECRLCTYTVHYTGTCQAGSTVSKVVDLTKAWTPGELVGKFVRPGTSSHGCLITSNDATSFLFEDRFNYFSAGGAYAVFTWVPTATNQNSIGVKGWFWPRTGCHFNGPVAGRGDGAILGPWDAPKDVDARSGENHFHGSWGLNTGVLPGEISDCLGTQQQLRWDPPYLEDANDLPVWNSAGRNEYFPDRVPITYTAGTTRKMEYYYELPTPGVANGIWRVWQDGILVKESTSVFSVETYYPASAVESAGAVPRPIIGGASRNAAYAASNPYFAGLWNEMTGGGAPGPNLLPENDMWSQISACAVSGAP